MVSALKLVHAAALRSREPAPFVDAARRGEAPVNSGRDGLDRSLLRAGHRRRAGQVLSRLGRRRARRRCAREMRDRTRRANSPRSPIPSGYADLKAGLAGFDVEIAAGPEAVNEAALCDADLVVAAIVGAAGLEPTLRGGRGRAHRRARQQGDAGLRWRSGDGDGARARGDAAADGLRAQRPVPGDRRAQSGHDRENDDNRLRRPIPRMERRADRRGDPRRGARPSQLGDGAESDDQFRRV